MVINEGRIQLASPAVVKVGAKGQYIDARGEIPGRRDSDTPALKVGIRVFGETAIERLKGKPQGTYVVFSGRVETELWDGRLGLRVIILEVISAAEPPPSVQLAALRSLAASHCLNPDTDASP